MIFDSCVLQEYRRKKLRHRIEKEAKVLNVFIVVDSELLHQNTKTQ
jgi:hypothetical protein